MKTKLVIAVGIALMLAVIAVLPARSIWAGQGGFHSLTVAMALDEDQMVTATHPVFLCTLKLTPSYATGTLSVDILIGTNVAATGNLWRTSHANSVSLSSGPVAVIEPPINTAITELLPPSGTVGILATLSTPELGIICSDFKTVFTGTPPE